MGKTKAKTKIGFYISSSSWVNHQRWPYEIARSLVGRGYRLEILATRGGKLYSRARRYGLKVHRMQRFGLLGVDILRLALKLKRKQITTLFINYPRDIKTAALAARVAGVSNVIYRRGTVSPVKNNLVNRFIFSRLISSVITNSYANKRGMIQSSSKMFDPDTTRVIYNGLKLSGSFATTQTSHNYRNNGELMVGMMTHDVQPARFLRFFEILEREGADPDYFRFLLHGNGKMARDLKANLRNYPRLRKMVVWDNHSRNLVEFMNSIDVFMTGNTRRGFNHPLVYAMARNKPVIGYDEGSNPEVITHDENGYLLNRGNVEGIKEKLEKLRDPQLRLRLGQEARRSIERRFTHQQTIDQIEALLK